MKFTDDAANFKELHRRLVKQTDLPRFEPVTATLEALVKEGERLVAEQVRIGHRPPPPAARYPPPPPPPKPPPPPPPPQDAVMANKLSEEYLRFLKDAKKRGPGPGVGLGAE